MAIATTTLLAPLALAPPSSPISQCSLLLLRPRAPAALSLRSSARLLVAVTAREPELGGSEGGGAGAGDGSGSGGAGADGGGGDSEKPRGGGEEEEREEGKEEKMGQGLFILAVPPAEWGVAGGWGKAGRGKNALQITWVLLLKAHRAAGKLTGAASVALSVAAAARRRVAARRTDSDDAAIAAPPGESPALRTRSDAAPPPWSRHRRRHSSEPPTTPPPPQPLLPPRI